MSRLNSPETPSTQSDQDQLPPCVEAGPTGAASASIIWLHGLGADGHDFEPIVPELNIAPSVRFIFPHAPQRPVTVNGGYVMRAWYDITSTRIEAEQDAEGIAGSAIQVEALIAREIERGVPAGRIVLAGFSQGGAVALHAGLRYGEALAGILALSTYLPLAEHLSAEAAPANRGTPIFMGHGTADPIVPIALGHASRDRLSGAGYCVEWHEYAMAHSLCPAEIADIGQWLRARLP